jgi:inorganic pyrophosphatase
MPLSPLQTLLFLSHIFRYVKITLCIPKARMSAFLPIADIAERDWDVRFVPKADSCSAAINAKLTTDIV